MADLKADKSVERLVLPLSGKTTEVGNPRFYNEMVSSAPSSAGGAPSVEDVARVLAATPSRLAVLRFFLDHQEATAKDLMEATGLSRNAAGHHLTALRAAGVLHERRTTHPRGQGLIGYWVMDRAAMQAVRDGVVEHLT